jgi:hypothetical protein
MTEALSKNALTRRGKYSQPEIDAGLTAVALMSGNTRRASTLLARSGQRRVAPTTLHRWSTNLYVERYRELQAKALPELNRRLADAHDDLVVAYSERRSALTARCSRAGSLTRTERSRASWAAWSS